MLRPDARQRGLSLTPAPTRGTASSESSAGPAQAWNSDLRQSHAGRVAAHVGYAMGIGGGRGTVEPYAGVEWENGDERTRRFGARWRWGKILNCRVEARHDTATDETDAHAFIVAAQIRW